MNPIPDKGFFDSEPTDSLKHHKQRVDQMRKIAKEEEETADKAEKERVAQELTSTQRAKEQEIEYLNVQAGIVREGETRDMLLERIRKLRETKVEEPRYIGRNEEMQKQYEAEQAAGRAAVAAAEAREEELRIRRAKIEEEDRKRLGSMEQVYRPNEMEPKATPDMKRLKK